MKTSERFAPLVLNVNFSANGNGIPMVVGKSIVGGADCSCGCSKGDGGGGLKVPVTCEGGCDSDHLNRVGLCALEAAFMGPAGVLYFTLCGIDSRIKWDKCYKDCNGGGASSTGGFGGGPAFKMINE